MPEDRTRLTDYRYGGHSAVSDDHGHAAAGDVKPASHDHEPAQPYVPSGLNEPAGVERYGMYGVAQANAPGPTPAGRSGLPEPLPGQFDGDGVRTAVPASEARLRERLEIELAGIIDPGIVQAELHDGVWTLRGTVRDLATRLRVEAVASECLPDCVLCSELRVATEPAAGRAS